MVRILHTGKIKKIIFCVMLNKYHILFSLERNLFGFLSKNEELDNNDDLTLHFLNGTYSDIEWDITKLSDCKFIGDYFFGMHYFIY